MTILTFLSETITAINPVKIQATESPLEDGTMDITALYEIVSGLPDQIMAVLLAYLCFKTFLDMVK